MDFWQIFTLFLGQIGNSENDSENENGPKDKDIKRKDEDELKNEKNLINKI